MFGFDIISSGIAPALGIALVAGILSFLSPCVLPIVPAYIAFMSGAGMSEISGNGHARRRALIAALAFVFGLSTVFVLLGLAASALGLLFLQYQWLLARIAGVVVALFGLHFLGVIRIPMLLREARFEGPPEGGSALGAYVFGLAFAFGWTPCIGPQLGAILALAATEGAVGKGAVLLAVYAAGLGLPFVLMALGIERAVRMTRRLKPHMRLVERIMGVFLLAVGILLLSGGFTAFSWWLLERFPALGMIG